MQENKCLSHKTMFWYVDDKKRTLPCKFINIYATSRAKINGTKQKN